jgi:beta-phosphoglucomutase-like phosphatase (HAD superfamily)
MILHSKAFIFDLNGTMIDDMAYHIQAWHQLLNYFGANLSYEAVKEQCYGKNDELLERIFPGRFSDKEKENISIEKERRYQQEFRPRMKLINGLGGLLEATYTNSIKMAIGSAAIRFNIDFVLDGLNIRNYFSSIVSADDVSKSKPDPETYLKCADELQVLPQDCIVFEDSPKGVEAAANANMKAVVITTMSEESEFSQYDNILTFINNYSRLGVERPIYL